MRSLGDCALRPRGEEDNGDGVRDGERDERRAWLRRWRRSVAGVTSAVTEADGSAFLLLIRLLLVGAEQQVVGAQQPPFPSAASRKVGLLLAAFLSSGLAALSLDLLLRDSHRLRTNRSGPCGRSSGSRRSCR